MRNKRFPSRGVVGVITAIAVLAATALLTVMPGSASQSGTYAVRVTVTNLAPASGTIQTPVWAAMQDGGFDLYDRGVPVSPELERLAEDGNTAPITGAFADSGAGVDTTIFGSNGPLFPGDSASHLFLSSQDQRYFSYASMVIPSNDAFVANGNPMAHEIFDEDGNIVTSSFVVLGEEVLDAGSEVNDEVPENTAGLAQSMPDTGVVEGGNVELHDGFLAGGNILAAIPNGDFTQEGYEALRFDFEVIKVDTTARTIYGVADGHQEVPAVDDTSAVGYIRVKIAGAATRIEIDSQFWNIDDVVAAHLHLGARGENGPVIANIGQLAGNDDLNDGVDNVTFRMSALQGPLAGMTLEALVAEIEFGNVYLNVHTTDHPAGEMRAQLQPTPVE